MKKLLLGGVAFAALVAGPAMAADLAVKAPVYRAAPVAVYSWSGFYIGVNAGGAWEKRGSSLSVVNDPAIGFFNPAAIAGVNTSGAANLDSSGFTGGGQIGFNSQSGNFVWGLELDLESLHQSKNHGGVFTYTTSGTPYLLTVSGSTNWLFTARPRIGWAVDRTLLYATGGIAVAKLEFHQNFADFNTESASISKTRAGWTIGGGAEYALTNNWTIKGEYLFARFEGDTAVASVGTGPGTGFATFTNSVSSLDIHILRAGINYKFDGPVVARY